MQCLAATHPTPEKLDFFLIYSVSKTLKSLKSYIKYFCLLVIVVSYDNISKYQESNNMKFRGIKRGQNIEILEQLNNIPDGTEIIIDL